MWTELTFETLLKFEKVCIFFCVIGKGRDLVAWRKCNSCQECSDLVLQSTLTSCSVMACAPAQNLAWHHLKLLVKLLLSHSPAPPQSADKHQSLQSFLWPKNLQGPKCSLQIQPCKCLGFRSTITHMPVGQALSIQFSMLCHCRIAF